MKITVKIITLLSIFVLLAACPLFQLQTGPRNNPWDPNADGNIAKLDPDFGTDGVSRLGGFYPAPGGNDEVANGVYEKLNGDYILAGWARDASFQPIMAVAKLNNGGQIDPFFGTGGYVRDDVTTAYSSSANAIAVENDIYYYVAGSAVMAPGDDFDFAVWKIYTGTFDSSFSGNGSRVIEGFAGGVDVNEEANDILIQADSKILLAGYGADVAGDMVRVLVRLLPNGQHDDGAGAFNVTGNRIINKRMPGDEKINGIVHNAIGEIFCVGEAEVGVTGRMQMSFLRVPYDGAGTAIESTWDNPNYPTGASRANDVVAGPDGKLIVVGTAQDQNGENRIVVLRMHPDGVLDNMFGIDGATFVPNPGSEEDKGLSVAVDELGRIIATGTTRKRDSGDEDLIIARFLDDGTLDVSFGVEGVLTAEFSNGSEFNDGGNAVIIDSGHNIVVAGYSTLDGEDDKEFTTWRFFNP